MSTEQLWHPDWGATLNSPEESARVRALFLAEKDKAVVGHPPACKCPSCGRFREEFAHELVRVCEANAMHVPGQDVRVRDSKYASRHARRVDATRSRLRQLEAGRAEVGWVLCAVETTICERNGMAYPPCAYEVQQTLEVEA